MGLFEIKTLVGQIVQLEPLQEIHRETLKIIAQDDRVSGYSPALKLKFDKWFNKALNKEDKQLSFVIRTLVDEAIVGSTRYYEICPEHKRLAIGYTWLVPAVWGKKINIECKLLLLQCAFEQWEMGRVEFFIDRRNIRSCAAVEKLGAKKEGVLRKHIILDDGHIRDTVVYSILKEEWPRVSSNLRNILGDAKEDNNNKAFILSRDEARELDRLAIEKIGMPGPVLMENAGRGAVDYLISLTGPAPITICCGKGNNAGDGFVIARYLDNLGFSVKIFLFSNPDELTGDAKLNYDIAIKSSLSIFAVNDVELSAVCDEIESNTGWTIDALLGTGLSGKVRPPYDQVIRAMNRSHASVLSIDVPSGLDCDTGKALGIAVKASYTATFMGHKKGFMQEEAKHYLGKVKVVDIGVPRILFNQFNGR